MNNLNPSVSAEVLIQREIQETKIRSLTVKRWLRTDETALYLGTTKMAIKHLVMRKKMRPSKWNGRLYFDRLEIDRSLENSRTKF